MERFFVDFVYGKCKFELLAKKKLSLSLRGFEKVIVHKLKRHRMRVLF